MRLPSLRYNFSSRGACEALQCVFTMSSSHRRSPMMSLTPLSVDGYVQRLASDKREMMQAEHDRCCGINIYIYIYIYCVCIYICVCVLFIYVFIHAFMHSCIHAFMHSCIHAFMHSCIHAFIHSFVHSFIRSFIHSFIHSSIHPFIGHIIWKTWTGNGQSPKRSSSYRIWWVCVKTLVPFGTLK